MSGEVDLTVLIPCRNEAVFIGGCLDAVLDSHLPGASMEVLVLDGMSDDGTRGIVGDRAAQDPRVRLMDNPGRTAPCALNRGIAAARGRVIARVDAHSRVEPSYFAACIAALVEDGADAAGGVMRTEPREHTPTGRAIATALSHPFGVGNSAFRTGSAARRWVDTIFNGCYRRQVFALVGPFNERLVRGQDMEYHLRMKARGLRLRLLPHVASTYYARAGLAAFWRHNWLNGRWAILPFRESTHVPVGPRHLVPAVFVLGLAATGGLALVLPWGRWLLLGVASPYLVVAVFSAVTYRAPLSVRVRLPVTFLILHVAYGLGSVAGAIELLFSRRSPSGTGGQRLVR